MEKEPVKKELNLFLGYTCNNNCWFCSEMANKGKPDKTSEEVKRELNEARRNGVQRITFTGGEPTIRKDIIELVRYAKALGFEEIFIITNGRMLYYKELARKLSEAGLTHILFSLHSPKEKTHDFLTRSPGSFKQTVQGIKNTVEVGGIIVENNAVITKKNYKQLPELAKLLVKLGVDFYEFIFLNPITINSFFKDRFEEFVPKISEISEYVHRAIDVGRESNVWCTAEGIPFCYMNGYEKHVTELYMAPERIIIGPGGRYVPDVNKSRREHGKVKAGCCAECKFNSLCEGVWGHYAEHYGVGELKPVMSGEVREQHEF